jgi:hypothetical protein
MLERILLLRIVMIILDLRVLIEAVLEVDHLDSLP